VQSIQLYIGEQRLDFFKDESVSITQTIQDVKDIKKVFTEFTKTFTIPASKKNNKVFKHYYNFDIDGGFDARIKVDATLELNNLPFKNGKVKLEGVDLRNRRPYAYRITFYGNTVNLKDLIGEDKLGSLPLNQYNDTYSADEVINKLRDDPATNDIICPLITHTQRLFYDSGITQANSGNLFYSSTLQGVRWDNLKYALRVPKIVEAIESKYGLTFSTDFFNDTNPTYNDLFMWLHRKKGEVAKDEQIQFYETLIEFPSDYQQFAFVVDNEISFLPFDNYYCDINLRIQRTNNEPIQIVIYENEDIIYQSATWTGTSINIDLDSRATDLSNNFKVIIKHTNTVTFTNIFWDIDWREIDSYQGCTNVTWDADTIQIVPVTEFIVPQQIPEMKTIDFLTGLFKMFNLTTFVETDGTIYVDTLDNYYTDKRSITGAYDISQYIDVKKSQVDVALPYRRINIGYKDTDTFFSAFHQQLFGSEWGEEFYQQSVGGRFVDGKIYNIQAPFGHMKYERLIDVNDETDTTIQWGWNVDDNQEPYKGDPLLFYPVYNTIKDDGQNKSINIVTVIDNNGDFLSISNASGQINMPSNSRTFNAAVSSENINFKPEVNEFTRTTAFTDTLFERFYKTYIQDVFNPKRRLTKVTAYLPLKILLNFTLADRFDINGRRYLINKITTNLKTGESKIEILNEV